MGARFIPILRNNTTLNDDSTDERAVLVRILLAIVWAPIQIVLSLFFATGGIFLLLILGLVVGPFVGLFFLVRRGVRRLNRERGGRDGASDNASGTTAP